jgi:hypothetical protein
VARALNQGGWEWPPELDTFDPVAWDGSRAAWHLARARACPDSAVKLHEIQMASQRPWLDGPAGEPGGVMFVLPPDAG